MQRDLRTYLGDIPQCIAEIDLFTANQALSDYEASAFVGKAVEREFTIIAEAVARISRLSPEVHRRIDKVRNIADFRNFIVHQYPDIDDTYVWRVIVESVPPLKEQVEAWAAELDDASRI